MKKCIIKIISVFLTLLLTVCIVTNNKGLNLDTVAFSEEKTIPKILHLDFPITDNKQALSTKSTTYYNLSAEVGDVYDLYLSVTDSSGNPIYNFNGIVDWSTENSQGILFVIDENDSTHCTVTIISYDYGKLVLTATANGNTTKYEFTNYVGDVDPFEHDFWIDGNKGTVELSFNQNWFNDDSKEYIHDLCRFTSKYSMIGYEQGDGDWAGGTWTRLDLNDCLIKCGFNTNDGDTMDPNNPIWQNFNTGKTEVNYFIADRIVYAKDQQFNLVFAGFIGSYNEQWLTDFDPGFNEDGSEVDYHAGFVDSKNYTYGVLKDYIERHHFDSEKTMILLTGHSRGAATANLLAAQLIDSQEFASKENIYTYTFATPKVTTVSNKYADNYLRIFNIVNPEDFVTKFMPISWGFGRFGKTFTLPSKTNCKSYNFWLSEMQHYYKKYTGENYQPFSDGENTVYNIMNAITPKITSTYSYCMEEHKFAGEYISTKSFIQKFVCAKFVNDSNVEFIGLINKIFFRNTSTFFRSIIAAVIDTAVLNNLSDALFDVVGKLTDSHRMETYCAFISELEKNQIINNWKLSEGNCYGEYGCYKGIANCPVDVEIYEKATSELVGRIKDNVVDKEIAAKPNSVVMTVNGDSKSFWLPSDGDYDVKLIGNDNGTMDYSIIAIGAESGEVERANYFDVPITKNEAWFGTTSSEGFDIEEHTLTSDDGTALTYTEDINEEEKKFSIDINIEGNGTADTSRTAVSGDYVAVTATPDEGNTFDGWYENGELLTSDAEYAFVAKSNRTLVAKFSENASEQKYTATFVADGKVIKIVEFTDGTAKIDEPEVPYKEGYTGKWSEYVLSASDITINAVYEKISDNNPTANVVINVAGEKTIKYRTKVTIKATAANLDSKYHLVLCINGKEIKGNNKEVSYEYGELKNDVNYTVKIVDESNITQKDKEGKELKKSGGKITCNAGFFVRLIAFFQGLFNALPSETVEPK